MRTPLLAGNWKQFKTTRETTLFCQQLIPLVAGAKGREIFIFPPFVNIPAAVAATHGTNINVGAQNLYWQNEGAFTGEVSAPMLVAAGCHAVIIGHSERRQHFGEVDATVLKKTAAAIAAGLLPIVCLGETLDERESGRTEEVLATQFSRGLASLSADEFSHVVIAYEPVWAIGTGRCATPDIAAAAHKCLRDQVFSAFGAGAAESIRLLYGGSVKPDNIKDLMARPDIDGALVGGASLNPNEFSLIVNY